MALPISFYGSTITDFTKKADGTDHEETSWEVPVITVTAANLVAQAALHADLQLAVDNVTLGVAATTQLVAARNKPGGFPTDYNAQRECKLLCRYHDATTHKKYRVSFGTFDLGLLVDGSQFLDLADDEGLALKTAFEAVVRSPDDASHAVILDSAQHVGRNT